MMPAHFSSVLLYENPTFKIVSVFSFYEKVVPKSFAKCAEKSTCAEVICWYTFWKIDQSIAVSLWILWFFSEQLFCRTIPRD